MSSTIVLIQAVMAKVDNISPVEKVLLAIIAFAKFSSASGRSQLCNRNRKGGMRERTGFVAVLNSFSQ